METNFIDTNYSYQNREISPVLVAIVLVVLNSVALTEAYYSEEFGRILVFIGLLAARAFSISYVYDIATNLKLDKRFWIVITIIFPIVGLCVTPFLGKGNRELFGTKKFDRQRPTYTESSKLTNVFFVSYLLLMLFGFIFIS